MNGLLYQFDPKAAGGIVVDSHLRHGKRIGRVVGVQDPLQGGDCMAE
jgi:hypothetical protein